MLLALLVLNLAALEPLLDNLFLYRDMQDPIFAALRSDPKQAVLAALPGLQSALGDFEVTSKALARPVDLTAAATSSAMSATASRPPRRTVRTAGPGVACRCG